MTQQTLPPPPAINTPAVDTPTIDDTPTQANAPISMRAVRLRLWLPLCLVITAVLAYATMMLMQYQQFYGQLEQFAEQTALRQITHTQRDLESVLRRRNNGELTGLLAEFTTEPDVLYAALADDHGIVLAASDFSWRGALLSERAEDFPNEAAQQALKTDRPHMQLDLDHKRLWALAPVSMNMYLGTLRGQRQGTLLVVYDLAPKIQEASSQLIQRVSVFGAIVLAGILLFTWVLHKIIIEPVRVLQRSIESIGQEDFSIKIQSQGAGEFSVLGDALMQMSRQLQANQLALKEGHERYRDLANATFESIIIHDGKRIVDANKVAERLLGAQSGELAGRDIFSIFAPEEHGNLRRNIEQQREGSWSMEMQAVHNERIPCEIRVRNGTGADGNRTRIVAVRDLREQLATEQQISMLLQFDMLTGIANRQTLNQHVQTEIDLVQSNPGRRGALVTLGINNFRSINDSLGMASGDRILRTVAQRLTAMQAQGNLLARTHGDTFAVLVTDLSGNLTSASSQVAQMVDGWLAGIAEPIFINNQELHLSACAGIVMIPNDSQDAPELLREAETAMHQAKEQEGNTSAVQFFAHSLQEAASARLTLRNELRYALNNPPGGLLLNYQPQLNTDRKLVGVEALVRWQHPERGFMPPNAFIAEAEASGLIVPLGRWVLEEAISCLLRWQADPLCANWAENLSMAVNVSPRQFREPDFVDQVQQVLESTGVNPKCIELELTESVVADDLEATLIKMDQIRALGLRFALDDFGTGYSSLAYLKRLPIDVLKIDRSFVMDIDSHTQSDQGKRPAVLIDAIVAMAHQMELKVLAEGVETPAQVQRLQDVRCDMFQGYYFSRPLQEDVLRTWALEQMGTGEA